MGRKNRRRKKNMLKDDKDLNRERHADEVNYRKGEDNHGIIFANSKRTYDAYQDLDLTARMRSQTHFDEMLAQARRHAEEAHNIVMQLAQNGVQQVNFGNNNVREIGHKDGLQATRHGDLSIDQQWNLEPSEGAAESTVLKAAGLNDSALKAINAMIIEAVGAAIKKK